MSFPTYSEFRGSGHDWLGDVPAHWNVGRFRHHFLESSEKIDVEIVGPMLSVSGYRGIEVKEYDDENRKRSDDELVGYRIVRPGQLVVNTMWLNYAGLGVSEHEGHVSPAYRCYWIDRRLDKRYVHHLMRSSRYVIGYTKYLTGIRPNSLQMSREDLMVFPVLIPPQEEQSVIADFLDRETTKIDALVAEQEKLIALLKEKRQAIISQAVTKGLDPSVPMKDSGLEWLGEVPAHWEVIQIRALSSFITSGPRGWSDRISEEGALFIQSGDLTEQLTVNFGEAKRVTVTDDAESARTRLIAGDVVVCITGARTGNVAVCDEVTEDAFVNQHLCLIRPTELIKPLFLGIFLKSDPGQRQFLLAQYGLKQGLSLENVKEARVAVPPIYEQLAIIDEASRRVDELDRLMNQAVLSIELLRERRSVLISAAVTGQIDVRQLVQYKSNQGDARCPTT